MKKKQHPYLKLLIDYSNDVVSGKVVACKKHIWSCQRFLNDLDRQTNDPTFNYEFIPEKAIKFSEWARLFKHRKGVLAGEKIELAPIAHFVFGNIYGWYHKDTGYRRFNKMYWQEARKNAKSQYLSLVASYELFVFTGDEVAEVYSAATKKDQAKIVYDETVAMMRGASDVFQDGVHWKEAYGRLQRIKNGAFMRALSEDDKKKGDGYNPQCGIIDEYHSHETSEIYDIIDSGMGARAQPLLAIITTAGFELNNPCYRVEYDLVSRLLNPDKPTELDTYFAMVNELDMNDTGEELEIDGRTVKPGELIDDIKDEAMWEKANPVICSYPEGITYLRTRLAEALEVPEKMGPFMTKHMNVWINERAIGYMNMPKWSNCAYDEREEDLSFIDLIEKNTDKSCYLGLDLSAKLDLTSCGFEFLGKNGEYYIKSHSFMPEERFLAAMKQDNVPYDLWEKQGYLTITEGAVVDYTVVKDYFISECKTNGWNIEEVCLDSWGATALTSNLIEEGLSVIEIIQGIKTLSEPTKNFRELVYQRKLIYEYNPLFSFAVGNAVTRHDHNENMMLDKSKAKQRIDPIAAVMNAHVRAMVNEVQTQGRVFVL